MKRHRFAVAAFCNPLMDVLSHVNEHVLSMIGAHPGTMSLVDEKRADEIFRRVTEHCASPAVLPGGSGANTARGYAYLNRDASLPPPLFFGAVGEDDLGRQYVRKLTEAGVQSGIVAKAERTGFSVIAVTPDGERTMFTHLGACRMFGPADVDFSLIVDARILHLTGYMWDTFNQRDVARRAAETARNAGAAVSLDLADPFVVERYRMQFLEWIPRSVDVLFGNRAEFALLCGAGEAADEVICERAAVFAPLVVMKVGERGAYVIERGRVTHVPGFPVAVRDTTGAGDSFAGAFLYAFMSGRPPAECARLGNRLAAAIVGVEGCDYGSIHGIDAGGE